MEALITDLERCSLLTFPTLKKLSCNGEALGSYFMSVTLDNILKNSCGSLGICRGELGRTCGCNKRLDKLSLPGSSVSLVLGFVPDSVPALLGHHQADIPVPRVTVCLSLGLPILSAQLSERAGVVQVEFSVSASDLSWSIIWPISRSQRRSPCHG